jgi:uncharacterized membrane protein YGL010W
MKKIRQQTNNDSSWGKPIGIVIALIGWLWTLDIVIDGSTPSYIRQGAGLLLIGSIIVFYYDNVDGKPSSKSPSHYE